MLKYESIHTMNEEDINVLNGNNYSQMGQILDNFLRVNDNAFTFPFLSENNIRVSLWAALFKHLQTKSSEPIHALCLATIRLLSRDKSDLENLICEKWMLTLIERAGFFNFLDPEDTMDIDMSAKEVVVEAVKCLCNITFNSEVARALCAQSSIAQGLVARLRSYKEIPFKDELMLFDMKLLFILTALRQDMKAKIKDELHGMDYLISCLNELVLEGSKPQPDVAACSEVVAMRPNCFLQVHQLAIACDILKIQFNLILCSESDESISEEEESMFLKLMPLITALLYAQTSSQEKLMELHINIVNLLTGVPPAFYQFLTPELNKGESAQHVYEGRNMDSVQSLLKFLLYRLSITTSTRNQYQNLSPILAVLNKSARSCRAQRKFLRGEVLPPLRDVSHPPERGNTLRNQLCRLLTTPVTSVRDLVAEFLFILCKEKVGRMVKYTGFGNAAGHLAQKGLLGAARGPASYSSSSDSDTEEYLEAQPRIDPVVGCTRPPRPDPFRGMTDEQKEYEAMKLVDLFDKLVSAGAVRPARPGGGAGPPRPLAHVLELRDLP